MRHPFERQRFRGHDLLAHQVGDRHLGGRDEVERLLAAYREQILLELRQLPGADQRLGLHQVRHVHLGVAMLARMQVQHELRQGPVQARHLRAHHHEAGARDARRGLEVEPREPLADLHVIARLEREVARFAPAPHLEVGALVVPVGDRGVQQIRQPELPLFELGLHGSKRRFRRAEARSESLAFGDQRAHVLAAPFSHADRLGVDVALGAQPIHLHLPGLALLLQGPERRDVERIAAPREIARHGLRIGAQQLRIDQASTFRCGPGPQAGERLADFHFQTAGNGTIVSPIRHLVRQVALPGGERFGLVVCVTVIAPVT